MTPAARRILILVPHPDDEVVGCCAAIGRSRAGGAAVHALYLTTGVPAAEESWPWRRRHHAGRVARRRAEAERAAARLGLAPVAFAEVPTRRLKDSLAAARATILAVLDRLAIDTVWVPAWEGGHQDHDAANALASTLADRVAVFEFAEYNLAGGQVRTQEFPAPAAVEAELVITPEEAALKRELLAVYASERGNLCHIGTAREALRPLPAHDYTRPPHPGRLFHERFHWVPFRHPRVDFTTGAEVRAVVGKFLTP